MVEIDAGINANVTGSGGAKFKAVSSFPKTAVACDTIVDKINGLREIIYVTHHTDKNGNSKMKKRKVRRKII